MTPEEFTKTQTVNVIYDPNGQHILEKHVYELMQDYAEKQLAIQLVTQRSELLLDYTKQLKKQGALMSRQDESKLVNKYLSNNCG